MKFFNYLICVFLLVFIFLVPSFGIDYNNNYRSYIELSNYYILIPDNQVEYISFTADGYFYFNSTSNVNTVLVKKDGSLWTTLTFNTIYFANTINNIQSEALSINYYYSNRVQYRLPNNNTVQHLSPIKSSDILSSDILPRHSDDFFIKFIVVILCLGILLDVYYIFSSRRLKSYG